MKHCGDDESQSRDCYFCIVKLNLKQSFMKTTCILNDKIMARYLIQNAYGAV